MYTCYKISIDNFSKIIFLKPNSFFSCEKIQRLHEVVYSEYDVLVEKLGSCNFKTEYIFSEYPIEIDETSFNSMIKSMKIFNIKTDTSSEDTTSEDTTSEDSNKDGFENRYYNFKNQYVNTLFPLNDSFITEPIESQYIPSSNCDGKNYSEITSFESDNNSQFLLNKLYNFLYYNSELKSIVIIENYIPNNIFPELIFIKKYSDDKEIKNLNINKIYNSIEELKILLTMVIILLLKKLKHILQIIIN